MFLKQALEWEKRKNKTRQKNRALGSGPVASFGTLGQMAPRRTEP